MLNQLDEIMVNKEIRTWILDSFYERKYKECLSRSFRFLKQIKDEKLRSKYDLWFVYSIIAKSYLKLGAYKKSLDYARISNWYAEDNSFERFDTMEVIANCYTYLNKNLAAMCFSKCYKYCQMSNNQRGLKRISEKIISLA